MKPDLTLATKKNDGNSGGSIVVLMLGLYLILLAFFILLNSISEMAMDKFEMASESIADGFGFEAATIVTDEVEEDITASIIYETVAKEIYDTFQGYLPIKDFSVDANKDQILVRLNPDSFFDKGEFELLATQVEFFRDFSQLLSVSRPGVYMNLDIVVPADVKQVTENSLEALPLGGMRAARFARALVERGVPPQRLITGATEQEGTEIILYFYVRIIDIGSAVRSVAKDRAELELGNEPK